MSNILKKVKNLKYRVQAAIDQRRTPVTEENLLACQFTRRGMIFSMGDLQIWKVGILFYYKSQLNKLTRIDNMLTVARLVYGKIKYGR